LEEEDEKKISPETRLFVCVCLSVL
jgi:hypothetical protein